MRPFQSSKSTFPNTIYLIALSASVFLFLILCAPRDWPLAHPWISLGIFFLILLGLKALHYTLGNLPIVPFAFLALLIPYNFFYQSITLLQSLFCLWMILLSSLILKLILDRGLTPFFRQSSIAASILLILYAILFAAIPVLRHVNFQNINAFDVAIYSQLQWNTMHGRLFETSISGSNFVTHNSPFLILLTPLYALRPSPETLLAIKSLFISLSSIPFYFTARLFLCHNAALLLSAAYLFFPFIIGQHFNAPHETCFLPPLLISSFYFFHTKNFKWFIFFLLLSLSVKEHMSLAALMYGLYAFIQRRSWRWVLTPLIFGTAWAVLSLWIIHYFQSIYSTDPLPAWLIANIKSRFLRPDYSLWENLGHGLATSNMGNWHQFSYTYVLLSPLLLILPFFSLITFLGAPELIINLLASFPNIFPTLHYNTVISCFMLIGCANVIQRFSQHPFLLKLGLVREKSQEVLSCLLLTAVACHFFLWWDYTQFPVNPAYNETLRKAIALVPLDATVSLTKDLSAYVTDRKDYFLQGDKRSGDYMILHKGIQAEAFTKTQSTPGSYREIFNKDGIKVLQRE